MQEGVRARGERDGSACGDSVASGKVYGYGTDKTGRDRHRQSAVCLGVFFFYHDLFGVFLHNMTTLGPKSGVEDSAESGNNCSDRPVVFVHVIGTW